MNIGRTRAKQLSRAGAVIVGAAALLAVACGGGTSSADKTATAAAKPGAMLPSGTTEAGVKVADSALGKILVDARGFTLYTFTNDIADSGQSAAEELTAIYPPLSLDVAPTGVAGATGAWAVFTRADGRKQVTYKGMPLYFFVNDKVAGEANGGKVPGTFWFVAVP